LKHDSAELDKSSSLSGLHTGIGIVVPAQKILETLSLPELLKEKERLYQEHMEGRRAEMD
jgi:hypothetical protein